MPTEADIVSFLQEYQLTQRGESPWPSLNSQDLDALPLNWTVLFPRHRSLVEGNNDWDVYDDNWEPEFEQEFMSGLEEALSLGPPADRELDGMAESNRWDTCAWYQPIHYFGPDWCICIRQDCILAQALRIARFLPKPARPSVGLARALVRASTYAYFLHEQYHHKVESLAIRLEVIERRPIYTSYDNKVYLPARGTDDQLEEALANASIYRRLPTDPYERWISEPIVEATLQYLLATFPHEPRGYRKAVNYLGVTSFEAGENRLHGRVHEATSHPVQPATDWAIATRLMQSLFKVTDKIWVLVTPGGRPILPSQPWP